MSLFFKDKTLTDQCFDLKNKNPKKYRHFEKMKGLLGLYILVLSFLVMDCSYLLNITISLTICS